MICICSYVLCCSICFTVLLFATGAASPENQLYPEFCDYLCDMCNNQCQPVANVGPQLVFIRFGLCNICMYTRLQEVHWHACPFHDCKFVTSVSLHQGLILWSLPNFGVFCSIVFGITLRLVSKCMTRLIHMFSPCYSSTSQILHGTTKVVR